MKVTAAFEERFDVGAQEFAAFSLVIEDGPAADGAFDAGAFTRNAHTVERIDLHFGSDQTINLFGTVLEVLLDKTGNAPGVGLKRNAVAVLVFKVVEATVTWRASTRGRDLQEWWVGWASIPRPAASKPAALTLGGQPGARGREPLNDRRLGGRAIISPQPLPGRLRRPARRGRPGRPPRVV